jgi:porin
MRDVEASRAADLPAARRLPLIRNRAGGLAAAAIAALSATAANAADAAAKAATPKSIWEQETLTGDWGGARTALKEKGIELSIVDINEILGVLSGGLERRASYEGRTEFSLDTDLQKLIGWTGGTTHVTVFQIRNSGRTAAENAASLSDPSNIDALATTRLFTAWFQQNAFDDRVSLRIGQLAADDEFVTSPTAAGLISGTFGWPDLHSANLPSGGPAYPLAAPGVRLAVKPTSELTLQAAVFSGDPAGADCTDDPQRCNRYGTTFSFHGGAFAIGELQYAVNQDKDAIGLPGVYKLGGWYASADFDDQHYGLSAAGTLVSLGADPDASPLRHAGNYGFYAVADQMVWRGKEQSLNLFLRGGAVPADRNLVSFYVDGGAGFKGLLPGRADDTLTFGIAYAGISPDAAALDRDAGNVVRDYELVLEASYAAQIAPWWTLQPDIQYIVHPHGGQNPDDPALRLGNALIAGVRSSIKF